MAAFTSTQTGNFSAAATWGGGGAPSADGDTFTVANGHTVTIDTGITNPTNGFGDSVVQNGGILQSQASQSTTLRMDGLLRINAGGTLHLRAGATIEVTGTSSENHGIQADANSFTILEGSDGMPCTTLATGNYNEGTTSFTFTSAANFAAGEWFCIFNNTTDYTGTDQYQSPPQRYEDEGFWVHEVSSNTVYFRRFVSPRDVNISSVAGSTAIVTNSKRLRIDDQVIFGTGSNRNIKTVTAIDYTTDTVTFNSAISGTVTDERIYLTGTEKPHTQGDKVRKVATVTSAAASLSATQITLANATDFAVGDEIWIERRSEADGTTDVNGYWSSNYRRLVHTISAVSSNTVTVNSQIPYTTVSGALVTRLSRDVTFKCTTPATDHAHFYKVYDTTWSSKLIVKDVYFKDWGNDSSGTVQGVVVRGYSTTDNLPVTLTETVPSLSRGCWVEGMVANNYPDSTHQRDYGPIWFYDQRTVNAKCCVAVHGDDGISTYYEPSILLYNCITTGNDNFGMRFEGIQHESEMAYNYSSRNQYGYRVYNPYDIGAGVHNLIADSCVYALSPVHSGTQMLVRNSEFKSHRGPYADGGRQELAGATNKVTFRNFSGYKSVDAGTGTRQISSVWGHGYSYGGPGGTFRSVEHNWDIDQIRLFGYHTESYWDETEGAWRIFRRDDSSGEATFGEIVYVPQGTSFKLKASAKMAPSFSGTRPKVFAVAKNFDRRSGGANGSFSSSSWWAGYRQISSSFTSASDSDFETIEITVPAQKYNTSFGVGVVSDSSNATEGYWVKDIKVLLDTPYKNPAFNGVNYTTMPRQNGIIVTVGTSFDAKTRLGGRLS